MASIEREMIENYEDIARRIQEFQEENTVYENTTYF